MGGHVERDLAAVRRAIRAMRRDIPVAEQRRRAAAVAERVVELLAATPSKPPTWPRTVGATIADDGELDPEPTVAALVAGGATVAYPRVVGGAMVFAVVGGADVLVGGTGGVLEPGPAATPVALPSLDVVLVPLVAFDAQCNRLGRGRGFYDRTFAARGASPMLVGLAHDEQLVASTQPKAHDVPLAAVVTPTRWWLRSPG